MSTPESILEIEQQPGEPDASFAIRLAAQNIVLEEQAIPAVVHRIAEWEPVRGILRAWVQDAPLSDNRMDDITKTHGAKKT